MDIDFQGGRMDLGAWLKQTGFERYEAAFRDNGIDEAVLPHLTVEDLKEIGVATVGDRRKLLAAIAALASPTASGESAAPQPPSAPAKRAPEISAERRPITVMFCDLVGSTSLAARLDAEDWRNLVNGYLDAASSAVASFGGHVLKRLGDGLMALFGYPQAQENDAERAVRAALAIQRALSEINARSASKGAPELLARIGLESGPVVVDAAGEVFGEAPNVAARVQASAEPGAVLVTASVQRQTAGLFVAEDKGAHALKGVPQRVTLYRIVRASGGSRRSRSRALSPLVGRSEELDLLLRRWERARSGQGQFVQIVGEPGIGKSRLVEEFHARLGEMPHTWAEFSSSQLLQNTPLHPIAEWGRLRFGDADAPAGRRIADLENTLQLIGLDPSEHAPLIAPLVDIPQPPGCVANLLPEELRRRQLEALIAWFLAGARSQPAALAFEDLQWADPTSLDLMQALAERGAQAPLLILATARPEFRPPWSLRSHHSVISLRPLDRADVVQMVGELAARHALSKEVVEGVSQRTSGVPLFVEEVTRLLLERGEAGGLQAIPPTLQQSLAARLDRLYEAREVAQIGAVLGRDFSYALLQAVGGLDDSALQSALDRLAQADLFIAEGAGPRGKYRFKHALIQDAAYDSLLKSRRQTLHSRAAEILRDDPERAAAEPEVIAHHLQNADRPNEAIRYWRQAGEQAVLRAANREAVEHLRQALLLLDTQAESAERRRTELAILSQLGPALMNVHGWSERVVGETVERAAELASKLEGSAELRAPAIVNRYLFNIGRGEFDRCEESTTDLFRIGNELNDPEILLQAHHCAFPTRYFRGLFGDSMKHIDALLAVYHEERHAHHRYLYMGHDPAICGLGTSAVIEWIRGNREQAMHFERSAAALATRLGHTPSLTRSLWHICDAQVARGDAATTFSTATELLKLSEEHGLPQQRANALIFLGWALASSGDSTEGISLLEQGLDALRQTGERFYMTRSLCLLAESMLLAGRYSEGLDRVARGL